MILGVVECLVQILFFAVICQSDVEFNIQQKDEGAFFPIEVSFRSKSLYYDAPISSVESTEGHGGIGYSLDKKVTVDSFRIA